MSTDRGPTQPKRLELVLLLAMLACRPVIHADLGALCEGSNVAKHYTMVLDSVSDRATDDLRRLTGRRFRMDVGLYNGDKPYSVSRHKCEDSFGEGHFQAELPDALARFTSRSGTLRWTIQGPQIDVDLNPGVVDQNLQLALPLDGISSRWTVGSLAGAVAGGRLLPGDGDSGR